MIHRISDNVNLTVVDYDVTANGNGNAVQLDSQHSFCFVAVANTAASSGITIQFEVQNSASPGWVNIGSPVTIGASETSQEYAFDILPEDANFVVAGADQIRAVYSSVSGTVRADLYSLGADFWSAPPTWTNSPVFLGHTM